MHASIIMDFIDSLLQDISFMLYTIYMYIDKEFCAHPSLRKAAFSAHKRGGNLQRCFFHRLEEDCSKGKIFLSYFLQIETQ